MNDAFVVSNNHRLGCFVLNLKNIAVAATVKGTLRVYGDQHTIVRFYLCSCSKKRSFRVRMTTDLVMEQTCCSVDGHTY